MKAIHRVRNAKVGRKQGIDLSVVRQVCFNRESLYIFRCFGLDHVGENKLHVGRSRVVPQFPSDLKSYISSGLSRERGRTRLPNQPAAPVTRITLDMAEGTRKREEHLEKESFDRASVASTIFFPR